MAKAKNWAIVVGVNAYKDIGELQYANRDAEAMRDFFLEAKFDRVFCFADQLELSPSSEQRDTHPTSSNLETFLHDRFSLAVLPLKPGDNCWFFFAGHGKRIKGTDYLLPIDYNARLANDERYALSVNFVRESLLKSGADNVILLLDACRTEGDRSDGVGIGDSQPGAITIFSCQRNRKAYEIEALRQGAFTAALLEALRMPGERNCATVERLDLYLQRRVPQICQQYQKPEQLPTTYVEPRQKSYLVLLPEFATDRDWDTLRSKAMAAELGDNLEFAKQIWIRVIAGTQGQDHEALDAYVRVSNKIRPLEPAKPKFSTFTFEVITVDVAGEEIARKPRNATYFRQDLGDGVTLDMVKIPGGSFKMGAREGEEGADGDELPQHQVNIKEFWMGKFAVTQEQWKRVASLSQINTKLNPDPSNFKGDRLPVEQVSWHEAKEFCNRLSRLSQKAGKTYDLPTEAQWEYACRARTMTPFHFGETITTDLANFDGDDTYGKASKGEYREKTIEVGSFTPNTFGLYDMHGNVWEWCLDPWHGNYDGAPTHGGVWDASNDSRSDSRLLRGGQWFDGPRYCRSAYRNPDDPASRDFYVGFRIVCLSPSPGREN